MENIKNVNNELEMYEMIYYSYVNSVEDAKNKFANGATSYTLNIKMQDGSVSSRVYNTLPEFMLDYNKYMNSYANVKQSFEEKNRCK